VLQLISHRSEFVTHANDDALIADWRQNGFACPWQGEAYGFKIVSFSLRVVIIEADECDRNLRHRDAAGANMIGVELNCIHCPYPLEALQMDLNLLVVAILIGIGFGVYWFFKIRPERLRLKLLAMAIAGSPKRPIEVEDFIVRYERVIRTGEKTPE
jgi:hypothetical protein